MQREEMQGVVSAFGYIAATPQLAETIDLLDLDNITKKITQLEGFGEDMYNSADDVKKLRDARRASLDEARQIAKAGAIAGVNKDNASAKQQEEQANATARGSKEELTTPPTAA